MKKTKVLSKLALAGILSGGMLIATPSLMADDGGDKPAAEKTEEASQYKEVHGCKGQNVCKGLGGCSVTESKLKMLAEKAGVEIEKAGKAHDCHGKNECKGLGGCKVTAEQFKKLKEAKEADSKKEEKVEEDAD